MKLTHEQKILSLLESHREGVKTFEVNRWALNNFITSGDRVLRRLQNKGYAIGQKNLFDKVKTWFWVKDMQK